MNTGAESTNASIVNVLPGIQYTGAKTVACSIEVSTDLRIETIV